MYIHYKFYFEILSEGEIDNWPLEAVLREANTGELVAGKFGSSNEYISEERMAEKLVEFGSEPGFFSIGEEE